MGKRRKDKGAGKARTSLALLSWLAAIPAILAYWKSLDHAFVYDDLTTIVGNASLKNLTDLRAIYYQDIFRPVLNLSYAIDYRFWGDRSFGFHLTSLLLHVGVVLLVVHLLSRAIGLARGRQDPPVVSIEAILLAALWGVHPLLSESVGYASGRSEVLCGAFVLIAFLALSSSSRASKLRLATGIVAFFLALLVKEVAAMLPFALWLWDRLLHPGSIEERAWRWWRVQLPMMTLVLLAGIYRLQSLVSFEGTVVRAWHEYWMGQLIVSWRYLGLWIVPKELSLVHDVGPAGPVASGLAGLLWLAVLYVAFRFRERYRMAAIGLAWWLLFLAPSSLVPLAEEMAEHRTYLASIGPVLVLAELVTRAGSGARRRLVRGLVLVGILAAVWATSQRMEVWGDPVDLWRDAAGKAPHTWAPHYALGDVLQSRDRCSEAIEPYRRAIAILPDQELRAYSNLGICLAKERRFDEAEAIFQEALRHDPEFTASLNNLGQLALARRDPRTALDYFGRSLEIDPRNLVAHLQMATLYERVFGIPRKALEHCQEALRLEPNHEMARQCVARLKMDED